MSDIVDLLRAKSQGLASKASGLADDWMEIEKSASAALVEGGISAEEATPLLMKLASEANPNLQSDLARAEEYKQLAEVLEKTASYVNDLEVKLDTKDVIISDMEKAASQAEKSGPVAAIDGRGVFSQEELDELQSLNAGTLQKVANSLDNIPMNMGGPADRVDSTLDPLAQFLTS